MDSRHTLPLIRMAFWLYMFPALLLSHSAILVASNPLELSDPRPNILFYLTDDQSWSHTSHAGDPVVRTPAFDRVAQEGINFVNAFASAPSCAPMRASLLTGRYPWQIGEGALLFGGIRRELPLFTHALEASGYELGMAYKGYWPGNMIDEAYHTNPLGKQYHVEPDEPYPDGIANCDYAASFAEFLKERDPSRPFFFWMGVSEPHRVYSEGIGVASGIDAASIPVPGFLPDHPIIRSDLADYYFETEHQDTHLGRILKKLESAGELDNTIIVVTSDNGMPFPRAKATLYDHGTRVPLAVRWGRRIEQGITSHEVVNLLYFARTFLEIAGVEVPESMTGRSLMPLLLSPDNDPMSEHKGFTVTAMERHSLSRRGAVGYPMRALRTEEWLLIWNVEYERWPAGDPPPFQPIFYREYGDVDEGPTKQYLVRNAGEPEVQAFYTMAFGKRPQFELFHIPSDPDNLINLAGDATYAETLEKLKVRLMDFLKATDDPRVTEEEALWDEMPFYLGIITPDGQSAPVTEESHPFLFE